MKGSMARVNRVGTSQWLTHFSALRNSSNRLANRQKNRSDHPAPEGEHDGASHNHAAPAVQKTHHRAVGGHVERHDGDEGQGRHKGFHHGQQDRTRGPSPSKLSSRFFQKSRDVI